ncbi:MAG TPA: histidinol-phosphate transaminase [Candidatus Kapabacteria bacterium]|nr:histidinol-phosphate transaminase [Candidatus Kapabacteria bacterium]
MSATSNFIQRSFRVYEAPTEDSAIELTLDRTEPPIPYREDIAFSGKPFASSKFCSRYPFAHALEAELALRYGISAEHMMVTAGADEAIDRVCRVALMPGDELLTTAPTFEMIAKYGELAGAAHVKVGWLDGDFPLADLADRISLKTRLIVLVSPNNPTGKTIPADTIERLAKNNPNIGVLVDLAYVEFAESDPSVELLRLPNILLVRSFSKAWGLPGLRIGYAMGNPEMIQAMRAAGGPYSVAAHSLEIIANNFDRFELEMRKYVECINAERELLEEWLNKSGVRYIPSQSNFILLFPPDAVQFDRVLRSFGIRARSFGPNSGIVDARRLTLPGSSNAFAQLKRALENAFITF